MKAQRRVNRVTTGGRLAREAQDMHTAPRGQGGQPLALRLNDQLGVTLGCRTSRGERLLHLEQRQPYQGTVSGMSLRLWSLRQKCEA